VLCRCYFKNLTQASLLAVHVTGAAVQGPDELLLAELLLGTLNKRRKPAARFLETLKSIGEFP
jgi:hypothetical protein